MTGPIREAAVRYKDFVESAISDAPRNPFEGVYAGALLEKRLSSKKRCKEQPKSLRRRRPPREEYSHQKYQASIRSSPFSRVIWMCQKT